MRAPTIENYIKSRNPKESVYEINEIAVTLDKKILKESQTREQAVNHIYSLISSMDTVDDAAVAAYDVKLTEEDLHRITLWLDSCSVFYGVYEKEGGEAQLAGKIVHPTLE